MKQLHLTAVLLLVFLSCSAQRAIRDKHITNQQERMVFKQWSKSKFTPTKGFLGLNPEYWLTWAWHQDYPKKDLRPLGPVGPQTQRLAFAVAMQNTAKLYALQADTLRNTALTEAANYSALLATADPLWMLYYRHEFDPLLNQPDGSLMNGVPQREQEYLISSGVLDWYLEESAALKERLQGAMQTTLDRGSRIMAYHRMLGEYRRLMALWEAKKQSARRFLDLKESAAKLNQRDHPVLEHKPSKTDQRIADDILSRSKL